jgi:uncharacterized protein
LKKTRDLYRLVDAERGLVIADRVERAGGAWDRMKGLLGQKSLAPGEGLWLDPCNCVHTWFMRFAIDLLVLDREGRVLRIRTRMKPWRVSMPMSAGRSVVELAAGSLQSNPLRVGEFVRWERNDAE